MSRGNRSCQTGCYEDPCDDVRATSRECRVRGIWRTTRHVDKRAALHVYTAADRRPTDQVSARQAELGSHPTRATPRDDPHVSTRMSRGCYEETAPVKFQLYRVNGAPRSVNEP